MGLAVLPQWRALHPPFRAWLLPALFPSSRVFLLDYGKFFVEDDYGKMKKYFLCGVVLFFLTSCENVQTGTMTDPRDGKTYKTVVIGTQTWMAENLNYGMRYSWELVSKKTGRHYGRAYPWKVALKACPEGWHLPSGKEFLNLLEFLGGRGKSETGKKLLPRSFGRLNVTGFDAQMVSNHFFT